MRHVSFQAGPKGPVDTKGQRSTSRGDPTSMVKIRKLEVNMFISSNLYQSQGI